MTDNIPDAVFLDVDGVLIDSIEVKGDTFVEVFSDIPNSAELVRTFHQDNGGMTRTLKIRQLLELLGNRSPSDFDVSSRVNLFANIVVDRVVQAPALPGSVHFLQAWCDRCALYAVSATPNDELQRILEARGLHSFFRAVRGWPPEKSQLMRSEIKLARLHPSRCVFVGDSDEDYRAAMRASVPFIFFGKPRPGAMDSGVPRIQKWSDFSDAASEALGLQAT